MSRGDRTEEEWRILKGLLPIEASNRRRGRRPEENRSIVNGILWRLRCGTPWRDVPPKYGNWNTIYRRFRRWSKAGVWEAVSVTLAEIMADSGHDSINSTTVRAHVSAQRKRMARPVGKRFVSDDLISLQKMYPAFWYCTVGQDGYPRVLVLIKGPASRAQDILCARSYRWKWKGPIIWLSRRKCWISCWRGVIPAFDLLRPLCLLLAAGQRRPFLP